MCNLLSKRSLLLVKCVRVWRCVMACKGNHRLGIVTHGHYHTVNAIAAAAAVAVHMYLHVTVVCEWKCYGAPVDILHLRVVMSRLLLNQFSK